MLLSLKEQLVLGASLVVCTLAALAYRAHKRKGDQSEGPKTTATEEGIDTSEAKGQRKFGGESQPIPEWNGELIAYDTILKIGHLCRSHILKFPSTARP